MANLLQSVLNRLMGNGNTIVGSGQMITQEVRVSDFDSIEAEGGFTLDIAQDGTEALTVTTDDNILPHLDMEVKGRTLYLRSEDHTNLKPTSLHYVVRCAALKELELSGSASVTLDRVRSDNLSIESSGSAKIRGNGTVRHLEIEISGSGNAELQELSADTVDIEIAGSGNVSVHASERLDISIRGSGQVKYLGSPTVKKDIQGAGRVTAL